MKEKIKNLISTVADILYDESLTCDICGKEVFHGEDFCKECEDNLFPVGNDFCLKCGRHTSAKCGMCSDCKDYQVDLARSVFQYEGSVKRLIHKLKYRNAKYLVRICVDYLVKTLIENRLEFDIITYVPMTEKSEFVRGYNHTKKLAEELGKVTDHEVIDLLIKDFETKNQVGLSYKERKENLKGSFKVIDKRKVKGKRILVVDDVLTTGATSNEIAIELKKAKAESVYLLTLASVTSKRYKIKQQEQPL